MAILSSDKLVVVKAFAPGNPLPLDAREIYDSLAAAQEYAASSAVAYAGQTIKVVEGNTVTAFTLAPSTEEGVNYKLQFVGGGAGSIQSIGSSTKAGHITVTGVNGEDTVTTDVAVTGAYVGARALLQQDPSQTFDPRASRCGGKAFRDRGNRVRSLFRGRVSHGV